jgi:hypothetical protein
MSAKRTLLIVACLFCGLPTIGCDAPDPVSEVSTHSTSITLTSKLEEGIDWTPVAKDYNGSMFCVVDIAVDGAHVRTLGLEPSLDRYMTYCPGEGYEADVDAVLADGQYYNSWLFLRKKDGKLSGLLVRDRNAPAFSAPISVEEVEAQFVPLPTGVVYVEPRFVEALTDAGMKLPAHYVNLPVLWWDSVHHCEAAHGGPSPASQPRPSPASQPRYTK